MRLTLKKSNSINKVELIHYVYSGFHFIYKNMQSIQTIDHFKCVAQLIDLYRNMKNSKKSSIPKYILEYWEYCDKELMSNFELISNQLQSTLNTPKRIKVRGFRYED